MISSMDWHIIRLQDISPTPWRNGGGTTRELVAWPDAEHWQWRASVAEIEQSGPFSSFPGVQRSFAVLSGEGVRLYVDGNAHTLKTTDQVLNFDGAAQTTCQLISGATQDFNLMVQGGASAQMQHLKANVDIAINTPKIVALYAINTQATLLFGNKNGTLAPHALAWIKVDEPGLLHVQASDALLMEIEV